MRILIEELLPHAPKIGLFVAPEIPGKRLQGAIRDYAKNIAPEDVLALYDGTFLGNGRDGAVFLEDRLIFQNSDLEPSQTVYYQNIVLVESSKSRLRGAYIGMDVNRGRATFSMSLDVSRHPRSLEYMEKFLRRVMLLSDSPDSAETDWGTVSKVLDELRSRGSLTEADYQRLMELST